MTALALLLRAVTAPVLAASFAAGKPAVVPAIVVPEARPAALPQIPSPGGSPVAPLVPATGLQAVPGPLTSGQAPLIQTLSARMPEFSRMGQAESADLSRRDFEARAGLGRPAGLSDAVTAEEPGPDPAADSMQAALGRLSALPPGTPVPLGLVPSPSDLKAVSRLDYEVFLFRERGTGRWALARGDRHGVAGGFGDYDIAIHNHVDLRIGVHAVYSPYPSPQDLVSSAGRSARFLVISREGIVAWSPRVPFPDEPGRVLGPQSGEGEVREWLRRLEGTWRRRLVTRVLFPTFYPSLLGSVGVAAELRPWRKVTPEWLFRAAPPENEAVVLGERLPSVLKDELRQVAGKLRGTPLGPAEEEAVLAKTSVVRQRWYHPFTRGTVIGQHGINYNQDNRIELGLKSGWRRYPDLEAHFRVLFTHEYTHYLQNEGVVTRRYGAEVPAVAAEVLRAVELAGLEAARAGAFPTIGEGILAMFESGRGWARGERGGTDGFHFAGFLAGAAYEAAQATGRPEDAWRFFREASSVSKPDPGAVLSGLLPR